MKLPAYQHPKSKENSFLTGLLRSIMVFACLLMSWQLAHAQRGVTTMFDVEVRVPDESKIVQRAAFTKGLQQVLIRLSGDSQILQKLKLPPASRYVKQYRYESIEPGLQSAGIDQSQLWLQYDADKVELLLRENNIPVWSGRRDEMVLWLAIRDGMQHYLLKQGDISLIKSAADQSAANRGLPVIWPLDDATDRQTLRFADVWAGFQQPLLQASTRYSNGPILAGNLAWNGTGWISEWTLLDAGSSKHWAFESAEYATVVNAALNQIADDLGARYASLEDDSDIEVTRLRIELKGVNSVNQFKQAEQLLQALSAVKAVQLAEVFDDFAVFNVTLRTDTDDFLQRMLRTADVQQLQIPVATIHSVTQAVTTGNQIQGEVDTQQHLTLRQAAYRFQLKPSGVQF